jgi:hypothetical protein
MILYTLSDNIWVIKSRGMRWTWHVACMGERRVAYRVLVGKPDGKVPLGRLSIEGGIALNWIFK